MMNRGKFFVFGTLFTVLLLAGSVTDRSVMRADDAAYPGTRSDWNGYDCWDFQFEGRSAKIVVPAKPAEGTPWLWRARFFGHEPQTDIAMLSLGWHVVWIDSAPLMGSPESVALWQRFYTYLTETFGFSRTADLEGMSRGGLYIMNWVLAYPDEVRRVYIDNPVLDFKSWPGGLGAGPGSEGDWRATLASYGLTEETAKTYALNPIDNPALKTLAEKKVPILAVCGDSDKTVPFPENAQILRERYEQFGGPLRLILKPGNDHHPHSLGDPAPIVEFFTAPEAPTGEIQLNY